MRAGPSRAPVSPPLLDEIAGLVEQYSGLALEQGQQRALQVAVNGRMEATASADVAAYLALLRRKRSGEVQMLVEAVANSETAFFRNAPHFRVLREVVLPGLPEGRGPLFLWSAGCSTGEEAYSLAITCLEAGIPAVADVRVLGTDISRAALAAAERGEYSDRRMARLDPALRERYFERVARGWRVSKQVRSLVSWSYHNLVDPALPVPRDSVDILFCQNVTIYFRPATIRRVVARLADALREGGRFFPGFSETLFCRAPGLEMQSFGDCFAYRKREPNHQPLPWPPAPPPDPGEGERSTLPARGAAPVAPRSVPWTSAPTPGAREGERASSLIGGLAKGTEPVVSSALEEARAAAAAGRVGDARHAAARAAGAAPMLAEAWELLGLIERQAGRAEDAERAFRRQLYLDPESPLPHFHLATLFRESGRHGDAAREYARAAAILESIPPDTVLAGVTADLMLSACRRYATAHGARRGP